MKTNTFMFQNIGINWVIIKGDTLKLEATGSVCSFFSPSSPSTIVQELQRTIKKHVFLKIKKNKAKRLE
tara:strand:- start:143 stop:349 length:207 start_codon:yes stop_codon:yes gene_type:complete